MAPGAGGHQPGLLCVPAAFRELRRRGHLPDRPDGDAAADSTASDGHGPEERALASVAAAAHAAIRAMPPRRRACALLVLAAGLTAEETGQALGITPSTVRVQVHQARARLLDLPELAGGRTAVQPALTRAAVAPGARVEDGDRARSAVGQDESAVPSVRGAGTV